MIAAEQIKDVQELLSAAQTVFVIYGKNPSVDHLAVANALYSGIEQLGKEVFLFSPEVPSENKLETFSKLTATQTELGNQNLVVSFEYSETAVDKVSYHIGEETNRFYLTIKPQKGAVPLSSDKVEFSYSGAQADLVFIIGVSQLEAMERIYVGYEIFFETTPIIAISSFTPDYGVIQLNTSGTPSMSEAMSPLLSQLQITLDAESATGLLYAIEEVTNGLQSLSALPETFEAVAQLMRLGARRLRRTQHSQSIRQIAQPGSQTKAVRQPDQELEPSIVADRAQPAQKSVLTSAPTSALAATAPRRDQRHRHHNKKKKQVDGGLDYQPSSSVSRN